MRVVSPSPAPVILSQLPPGYCVYFLICSDGTLYTGSAKELSTRLARHAAGKGAKYTRSRLPVRLAYWEAAGSRGEALSREAALKRLSRVEKLALVRTFQGGGR